MDTKKSTNDNSILAKMDRMYTRKSHLMFRMSLLKDFEARISVVEEIARDVQR
jgi:hypothetical protein